MRGNAQLRFSDVVTAPWCGRTAQRRKGLSGLVAGA